MRRKLVFSMSWLILLSCQSSSEPSLNVAVAANALPALKEISRAYQLQTGEHITLIPGSSGKLYTQIMQGAPFDLFLSANSGYPQKSFDEGKGALPPEIYAFGKLVLWGLGDENQLNLDSLPMLNCPIALANPKHAPYGMAAKEVLDKLVLTEILKDRLVYGESISQCNQFILSQSACLGFSSLASVMVEEYRSSGHWTIIDPALYSPIEQRKLLLSPSLEAKAFYDYLGSQNARVIFEKYGYTLPLSP